MLSAAVLRDAEYSDNEISKWQRITSKSVRAVFVSVIKVKPGVVVESTV